jgi:peptidoglycan pentaglycine glycine transferase (the first glycine)
MLVKEITAEDRKYWNDFISDHQHGHLYQSYEWGEVLSYDGTKVFRLSAERGGRLCATMLVVKRRLRPTNLSYFYAPSGPILDFADRQVLIALLEKIRCLARLHHAVFLRVDPDYPNEDQNVRTSLLNLGFINLPRNWSYHNYPRIVMRLDLARDEETLLRQMRRKHRQHIRVFDSREMTIDAGIHEENLFAFCQLLQQVGNRKGFVVREHHYFHQVMDQFVRRGNGRLLLARQEKEAIAGVLSVTFGNKSWYLYGASNNQQRHVHPNERLQWEMIKWAKSRGCVSYDFGGTGTDYPVPDDSERHPLYHYKMGFGASVMYLTGYYDYVFAPMLYRGFRLLEDKVLPWLVRGIVQCQTLKTWKKSRPEPREASQ